MLRKVKKWLKRISLVSAVLAVFSGLQSDFAVSVFDTEVGGVVTWLHWSPEECPTRRANLKAGSSHYFLQSSCLWGFISTPPCTLRPWLGLLNLLKIVLKEIVLTIWQQVRPFKASLVSFCEKSWLAVAAAIQRAERMQTAEIILAICQSSLP